MKSISKNRKGLAGGDDSPIEFENDDDDDNFLGTKKSSKYTKNQKHVKKMNKINSNRSHSPVKSIFSLSTRKSELYTNEYTNTKRKIPSIGSGKNVFDEIMSGKIENFQNDLMDLFENDNDDDDNTDDRSDGGKKVRNEKIKEKNQSSSKKDTAFRRNIQKRSTTLQKHHRVLNTVHYNPIIGNDFRRQIMEEKRKKLTETRSNDSYIETNSDQLSSISGKFKVEYSLLSTHPPASWPSDDSFKSSVYYRNTSNSNDKEQNVIQDVTRISEHKAFMEIKGKFDVDDNNDIETINSLKYDPDGKTSNGSNKIIQKEDKEEEKNDIQKAKIMEYDDYKKIFKREKSKDSKYLLDNDEIEEEDFPCLKDMIGIDLPIEEKYRKMLSFVETLIIAQDCKSKKAFEKEYEYKPLVDLDGCTEIGAIRLSIESDANKFIIFSTSQFSYNNGVGGDKLLAMIDTNLNLIEEKKTEWHIKLEKKFEQSLHVFREDNGFTLYKMENENGKIDRTRGNIVKNYTGDFILDGGQFILMRYLILKKFEGKLKFWSMDISGELLKCVLIVGKRKIFSINKRPYETIQIRKELHSNNYETIVSKTYFLPTGHMVRHKWKDSSVILYLNPFSQIPPPTYSLNLQSNWKDDVILFSKYLDIKSAKQSEIDTYINDNPEFKIMVKDFLLATLIQKPDDVLEFAIEYFSNLCGDE